MIIKWAHVRTRAQVDVGVGVEVDAGFESAPFSSHMRFRAPILGFSSGSVHSNANNNANSPAKNEFRMMYARTF